LDAYTPKHLAEKILTSKTALEGERKQVTVLFADLKGSMELLADRDPEEARKLLDPVLERMMEAVHRYEGTVNQVMGDGIMALFGAPLAHEDHAVRACYACPRHADGHSSLHRKGSARARNRGPDSRRAQLRCGGGALELVDLLDDRQPRLRGRTVAAAWGRRYPVTLARIERVSSWSSMRR
jgi:class 3 adenylate cyclase